MPAVLVTGATVTQNSLFSFLAVAVAIVGTHYAYPLVAAPALDFRVLCIGSSIFLQEFWG